jgi:DNA repair protein RecN (Recombination protein N)
MLKELNIKDFAIIEDISIDFNDGMSAILGETGAGKSIIIEAFSLLLGNRANSDMIRNDKTKAIVSATISFKETPDSLQEYKDEDNNDFIFTRIINKDGNNTCKINGINVPTNVLKSTLAKKVNLHSQHDLFYLLDSKYHLSLLDKFVGNKINDLLSNYNESYKLYLQKMEEYNKLINEHNNIDIDYIKYQLDEIETIDIKENEIEEIEIELNRISKFDKISSSVNNIIELFDKNEGISDLLYSFKKNYLQISDDPLFSEYETEVIDLTERINDICENIKEAYSSLDFDPSRLEYLKNRQFAINKLKRKYGSYKDIMDAKEEFIRQIDYFNDKDYFIEKSLKEIEKYKNEAYEYAYKISNIRKENAKVITDKVIKELKDLYLDKTIFEVKFDECNLTNTGIDKVEFMISTNVGEALKPLSVVASGGEASRITLALNVVFNEIYDIDLAIFDEVDSGVSGKVARSMGKKMKELSSNYQTITISHLPQVLSYSNNFYYIGKEIVNGKTRSYVKPLNETERIIEIAKILSGSDTPSDSFINNARELLED